MGDECNKREGGEMTRLSAGSILCRCAFAPSSATTNPKGAGRRTSLKGCTGKGDTLRTYDKLTIRDEPGTLHDNSRGGRFIPRRNDSEIASADMEAVGFSAEPTATPQVRGGMMVSGNYFHVLGVDPQLGRGFREDEDQVPGRDAVVVLGPDFWKHEFASDPSLLGRTVRLNGTEFTVIGVAPETFPGKSTPPASSSFAVISLICRSRSTGPLGALAKNLLELQR
jgi:hypothetical protein